MPETDETRTYEDGLAEGANLVAESVTPHLTDEALADVNRLHAVLHPAQATEGVYEPERNPGGCDRVWCGSVLPEIVAYAEPTIRADERAVLQAAGRLLPEGGQTLIEWGVRNANGRGAWAPNASRRESAEYHAERLGRQLVRREVRQFDDGSSFSGPWVAVDPEEKPDA